MIDLETTFENSSWEQYLSGVGTTASAVQLLPYLLHDKKAQSGSITVVEVDTPGSFRMERRTPEEILSRMEDTVL